MKAFYISGCDADFDLFSGVDSQQICKKCGCLLDPGFLPSHIKLSKRPSVDMFSSSEGVEFVSDRLKNFLATKPGADFFEIQTTNAGLLHALRPKSLLAFDVGRRPVVFENRCEQCGQFVDIYRALPVYLLPGETVDPAGIYMTDLYSGHGRMKRRKLIVGAHLAGEIKAQAFKGISFDPVIE